MDIRVTRTLYELIGVPRSATSAEIEAACLQLGAKFNPEVNPIDRAAAERFAEIDRAYEVLMDPVKRSLYDASIDDQVTHFSTSGSRPRTLIAVVSLIVFVVCLGMTYWYYKREQLRILEELSLHKIAQERLLAEEASRQAHASKVASARLEEAKRIASKNYSDARERKSRLEDALRKLAAGRDRLVFFRGQILKIPYGVPDLSRDIEKYIDEWLKEDGPLLTGIVAAREAGLECPRELGSLLNEISRDLKIVAVAKGWGRNALDNSSARFSRFDSVLKKCNQDLDGLSFRERVAKDEYDRLWPIIK